MGSLKDIRLSWPAFGLLAAVSLAATVFIVATGNGKSAAQEAALAALRNPLRFQATSSQTSATNSKTASLSKGGGSDSSGGGSGGLGTGSSPGSGSGGNGGGGGGSNSQTTTTTTTTTTTSTTTPTTPTKKPKQPDAGLPHVGHVFQIALTTSSYEAAFGKKSQATYLRSLVKKGALLTNYQGFGKKTSPLADYIAMLSGQAPNSDTAKGCPVYKAFAGSAIANSKTGLVKGNGCVYPDTALTLVDQAGSVGDTWGAYIQSMGTTLTCQYPEPGQKQSTGIVGTLPGYSLAHNPFVYFSSLLEEGACIDGDLDLSLLPKALKKAAKTPDYTYIAPDECSDTNAVIAPGTGTGTTTTPTTTTTTPTTTSQALAASATSTAPVVGCPAGKTTGIAAEDAFLHTWVPKILASAAYKKNGVLIITFAPSGDKAKSAMVRTGALVISRYTHKALKIGGRYSPYAMLRSVEDMLNYAPLAHAKTAAAFAKQAL